MLMASLTLGLLSQQLKLICIIPIILLSIAIHYSQIKIISNYIKTLSFLMVVLLSIGLAAHLFPGFHCVVVLNQVHISKDAVTFSMAINFDKALIGIFILGLSHDLISNENGWVMLFKIAILQTVITIIIIVSLGVILGFIHFDPKFPKSTFLWIITNLLLVSVAEEAFFRGFLQRNFSKIMERIICGNYLAILCASVLFGLSHYIGGAKYMLLATTAGIGYGLIYDKTKRIESSIITHFGLNLTHFLFFTYPMLACP
jgi:membrane protease YdiL (CAAX protease family)